ncbi:MAG: serine hydrolase domain-containing protein, partial [Pseudomonadota bacterium]
PGSASGYGPQAYGYVVGEIYRRATGRSIGAAIRETFQFADGADFMFAVPESAFPRIADMTKPPRAPDLGELNAYRQIAFMKPWSASGRAGDPRWRMAEIPSVNGHANAKGVAAIMAAVACGETPFGSARLSPEGLEAASRQRIVGDDLVLPFRISWGAGFIRNEGLGIYGPNPDAVGHSGWGGSCGFADPATGVSFGYALNKMSERLIDDPRAQRLVDALYRCL